MDSITDEEKSVVEELRKRTINDMTPKLLEDTAVFYRFARARDFNLAEAETMLRKHIAWRKEMGIDTILEDYKPPEVLVKYAPVSFVCYDKEGALVRVHDCGRLDSKGFLSCVSLTEVMKYMIYLTEQDKENMIKLDGKGHKCYKLGKPTVTPIYDFEELTYSKAVSLKNLQLISAAMKLFTDNYPEYLRVVFVINAPFYFTWIYAAVKPLLPPRVIEKINVFGSDGWKKALLEEIDADDLPACLGGNRTDPDGNRLCKTFIMRGENIPKSYYMKKGKKKLAEDLDAKNLTVMPLSKEEITFEVKEENSFLDWEFETKSRDIEFSLLFREKGQENSEPEVLIPKQRIDTSYETEKGLFKCEKLGYYKIVFNNSFSWIRSKEIYYKAGIKSQKNSSLCESP